MYEISDLGWGFENKIAIYLAKVATVVSLIFAISAVNRINSVGPKIPIIHDFQQENICQSSSNLMVQIYHMISIFLIRITSLCAKPYQRPASHLETYKKSILITGYIKETRFLQISIFSK